MCRILAYQGPPLTLDRLVSAPAHSLMAQSYAPKEMSSGVVNADGYGLAWYDAARRAEPFFYKHTVPIWADVNLSPLTEYVSAGRVLGYIRSATPGQGLDVANTQPFVHGRLAFVHNGFVENFRTGGLHRRLRTEMTDAAYRMISGSTDSEHLFAWLVQHVEAAGGDLTEGTRRALAALEALFDGDAISLNFVLADDTGMVAVRHAIGAETPSLYLLEDHPDFPDAAIVASEPLFDDPAWASFPEHSMVTIDSRQPDRWTLRRDALAA